MSVKKRRPRRRPVTKSRYIKNNKRSFLIVLSLILVFIGVIAVLLTRRQISVWSGSEKIQIVVDNDEDGIYVVVLDPIHNEMHKFHYPEALEIEAAYSLGKWKIGNLWQLGEDEGIGGELLARTVTRSLKTPVTAWSGPGFISILENGYFAIPKDIFTSSETNLSVMDRIRVSKFANSIEDSKVFNYDVDNIPYLEEQTLKDGTEGYAITREPSTKILSLFANEYLVSNPKRAVIINSSDNVWKAEQFGEVMEVVGIKVAAIREETHEIAYCEVSSEDPKVVEIVSKYYDCEKNLQTSTNFDIELRIGDEFINKY